MENLWKKFGSLGKIVGGVWGPGKNRGDISTGLGKILENIWGLEKNSGGCQLLINQVLCPLMEYSHYCIDQPKS